MPDDIGGIVCRECGGSGCKDCNSTGWASQYYYTHQASGKGAVDIVPMPYGKILPSLVGSHNYNTDATHDRWVVLCPGCESDHVCCISPKHNDIGSRGLWFCISCQDSWRYEIEH